jgi:hypothetical protein
VVESPFSTRDLIRGQNREHPHEIDRIWLRRAVVCAVFVSCVSATAAQAPAPRLLVVLRDASMLGIFDPATKTRAGTRAHGEGSARSGRVR